VVDLQAATEDLRDIVERAGAQRVSFETVPLVPVRVADQLVEASDRIAGGGRDGEPTVPRLRIVDGEARRLERGGTGLGVAPREIVLDAPIERSQR
jgi:hypothetical protein